MLDLERLKELLVQYKRNFSETWKEEKYKWEAVKCFQDNWDLNAADFADMLGRSLEKTGNLLRSGQNFPRKMITDFAASDPEEVRAMFLSLYDETKDVYDRIAAFKAKSEELLEKYGNPDMHHFQNENSISAYLWLKFPDKYYLYKFEVAKAAALRLGVDCHFVKGRFSDNIHNFIQMYDEINAVLKKDQELVNLFRSQFTNTCYPDPELKTLTMDFCYIISKYPQVPSADDPIKPSEKIPSNEEAPKNYWWLNANPKI